MRVYTALCIIVILLAVVVRIHLADIPFERDEGEYAYAGQMILHGSPPYEKVYNMKFPGVYFMYALSFELFGERVEAPRYMVLILQLLSVVLLASLSRSIIHPMAGWLAAAVYLLYGLCPALQGTQANAEHFVAGFLIPAIYILHLALRRYTAEWSEAISSTIISHVERKWANDTLLFFSGSFMAIACMMKQHAFTFEIAAVVWIAYVSRQYRFRFVLIHTAGFILPVALMAAYLHGAGVWHRFYYLTILYAREYTGLTPLSAASQNLYRIYEACRLLSPVLFWSTVMSIPALALSPTIRRSRLFITLFLLAGVGAVMPGLFFRPHYFIYLLPALALVFTYAAFTVTAPVSASVRYFLLAGYLGANAYGFFYGQRDILWTLDPEQVSERIYPHAPFAISAQIASYIQRHSAPADQMCLVGTEPQLFFLSHRRSASGYIYVYPLLESQKYADMMTGEFISETERAKPAILAFTSNSVFEDGNNYNSRLYQWFDNYKGQYTLSAIYDENRHVFDTISPIDTLPSTVAQIRIYKRKQTDTR